MYEAACSRKIELVSFLIHQQAFNEVRDCLLSLARDGDMESIKDFLFKKMVNSDSDVRNGWTPLHYTAESAYMEVANILIVNKADVNVESNGWTPLHLAAYNSHTSIVKTLIENKADVNAGYYMWTPLCVAAYYGCNNGWTPLYLAAQNGQIDIVKNSIKKRSKPFLKRFA